MVSGYESTLLVSNVAAQVGPWSPLMQASDPQPGEQVVTVASHRLLAAMHAVPAPQNALRHGVSLSTATSSNVHGPLAPGEEASFTREMAAPLFPPGSMLR